MKDSVYKIKKYIKDFLRMRKITLMNRMAYRFNFFIMAASVLLQMVLNIIFLKVLYGFLGNIAGWGYYQALLIVATYMLIDGLMWVVFAYLSAIVMHIRMGSLDGLLIKPIDSQFFVSIWRGDPEDSMRLVSGAAVLIYAMAHLGLAWPQLAINSFFYVILLGCAFFIAYSFILILRVVSFWVTDSGALMGFANAFIGATKYPIDIIYHKVVRLFFSTVIPLAFLTTVPAKILVGGFDWRLISASVFLAIFFLFVSRRLWKFALNHYSGASG